MTAPHRDSAEGRAARGSGVVAASSATRKVGKAHRAWTKKKRMAKGENGMVVGGF
jgi:hypothetical protein